MNRIKHSITLENPPSQRIVKSLAVLTFCGVRLALHKASKFPSFMAQASNDVCDAWRETAQPKV